MLRMLMKPNSSIDELVQTGSNQDGFKPCTKTKKDVSLGKVTSVVPANGPSMIKGIARIEYQWIRSVMNNDFCLTFA